MLDSWWGWYFKQPVDHTIALAALITLVIGWFKYGRAIWKDLRRLRDGILGRDALIDSITGQPIPNTSKPSIWVQQTETVQQLEYLIGQVNAIEHEVRNNDGSSLKDSVNRVEAHQSANQEEIKNLSTAMRSFAEAQHLVWPAMTAAIQATPGASTDEILGLASKISERESDTSEERD